MHIFKFKQLSLVLSIGIFVFLLDQITKILMIELLGSLTGRISITPFFNLALGFNRGVSFGLLNDLGSLGPTLLSILTVIIICFLIIWLLKTNVIWEKIALSMIVGGAFGNLTDRIRNGAVTDFLDFYIGTYHWPTFNVADIGICIGAVSLVVCSFRAENRS